MSAAGDRDAAPFSWVGGYRRGVDAHPHTAAPARSALAPLYLAGFVTAFGAHGVAAALGAQSADIGLSILGFGLLLALYDLAEVVLKPVFGTLADRIGPKPVIVAGLSLFAVVSLVGFFWASPVLLGVARLGQGAAASAFSPASSAAVARMAGPASAGRYFGRYGSWKSLGYALGPLLGAGLVALAGIPALFAALAVLGAAAAIWAALAVPAIPPLPRPRYTVADLVRQTTDPSFLVPTLVLAAATGALGAAVGFLPLLGSRLGLGVLGSMAVVTVLALASTILQPFAGRMRDDGRLATATGAAVGLFVIAVGIAVVAVLPAPVTLYVGALLIGCGIGVSTPLAFAHLASTTPAERMGRTMGNAELGREVGDAGGPLLVGAVAAVAGIGAGLGVLALAVTGAGVTAATALRRGPSTG